MTTDEHERYYAERSKMTVDEIRRQGGYSVHCDCDSPGCPGYNMVFAQRSAEWLEALRRHVERGATERNHSLIDTGAPHNTARWFNTLVAIADASKGAKDLPPRDPNR